MNLDHSLTTLFHTYAELDNPPILELLNIDNKPVGALYLKDLRNLNKPFKPLCSPFLS